MNVLCVSIAVLVVVGGAASADRGHLTGSFRAGIGSTTDWFHDDAPEGNPWVLDLEVGWRALPHLSVVAFADYTRFTDDVDDPFNHPVTYHLHQRDLDLGVRIYGHLGPVFAGLGLGTMFHHAGGDSGAASSRGRLVQLIAGVDLVRTSNYAFGVVAHAGIARVYDDVDEIDQTALCLNARWR